MDNKVSGEKLYQGIKEIIFEKKKTYQSMAVRKGFEPLIRDERIHTFQACSFSHSDTSPKQV